ncbi:MAG: PKD domain-containing protein [Microthrixaceae bacterium]
MNAYPPTRGQSGMTLVETLLAVMLSGIMILPITGWATMAMREHQNVQTRNLSGSSLGILRSTFTRDVSNSDSAWVDDETQLASCSDGAKGTIALLALGHEDTRTTYSLVPDDDSYLLVRLRCAKPGATPGERTELASGVIAAGTSATCATGKDLAERSRDLGVEAIGTATTCRRITLQLTTMSLAQVSMTASLRIGGNGTATTADSPSPVAAADPTGGRRQLKVQFSGKESTDPNDEALTFQWDFGDGGSSTEAAPVHVFVRSGTYTVRLTATNTTGLSASTTLEIRVEDNPPMAVIASPANLTSFFRGQPVQFSSAGSNDEADADVGGSVTGYRWDFGDGTTSIEANPVKRYDRVSAPEGFAVTLTVTDNAGLSASTQTRIVVNNRLPSVAIVASETTGVTPFMVDFSASVTDEIDMDANPALTYAWDFGNGTTSNLPAPSDVLYSAPGTFTVRLTVTDDAGASASATHDLTVKTSLLPAPTGLRRVRAGTQAGSLRYIDVAWNTVAGATEYQVELDSVTTTELVTVNSTATQVRAGGLTRTSKYYDVRVRAKNSSGEFGPWSAAVRMRS